MSTPRVAEYYIAYAALTAILAAVFTVATFGVFWIVNQVPNQWVVVYVILFALVAIGLRRYKAYKVVPVDD